MRASSDELGAAFAVRLLRSGDLGDALADQRLGDDELGLAAAGLLGSDERREKGVHLVAVDGLHVEPERLELLGGVLALRLFGHRVERHGVGVVDENQVVELLVTGKLHGFERHAFLKAAVASQANDVMIEDRVFCGVEARLGHLGRHRHAHRVGHTLTEGAGRRFHAARGVA